MSSDTEGRELGGHKWAVTNNDDHLGRTNPKVELLQCFNYSRSFLITRVHIGGERTLNVNNNSELAKSTNGLNRIDQILHQLIFFAPCLGPVGNLVARVSTSEACSFCNSMYWFLCCFSLRCDTFPFKASTLASSFRMGYSLILLPAF